MATDSMLSHDHRGHVVQFYDSHRDHADTVVAFLLGAVTGTGSAIAIVTPEHRAAVVSGLAAQGVDVDALVGAGRLVLLDAAATLDRFMVDGAPDPAAFDAVVGDAVRRTAADGREVRAYGEMVALLWEEGNVAGALALEGLWNRLGEELAFALLCGYPAELMRDPEVATQLAHVCHLHSAVVDPPSDEPVLAVSRQFAHASTAPREARRFVRESLRRWSLDHLEEDCLLVVSELTTNAVRHAGSAFSLSLSRNGGAVHVTVGDASPARPNVREPDVDRPGGRGLHLVGAMSAQWGQSPADDGKLVWAVVGSPT